MSSDRSQPTPWVGVTAALVGVAGLFQAGLAAGLPWGAMSYGGAHRGRLPVRLRRVSGVAAVVYGSGAVYIASDRRTVATRRVLTGVAALMAAYVPINLISPSPRERLWSPVCAATSAAAWKARPPVSPRIAPDRTSTSAT